MNRFEHTPLFFDCEASGLAEDSYPIDIAVAEIAAPTCRWLIDPSSVDSWTHWNSESQNSHGYQRYDLVDWGEDACRVAEQLHARLDGCVVLSDNPERDRLWVNKLYQDTGTLAPIYRVLDANDQFRELLALVEPDRHRRDERLYNLKILARAMHLPRHRAQSDAEYLRRLYVLVVQLTEPVLTTH